MLPNAKTVAFLLRWSCARSLVLAIIMSVIDTVTDCAKSEKIEDREGLKFYLRTTVPWPLCSRHS